MRMKRYKSILLAAVITCVCAAAVRAQNRTRVHYIDVGQGDAILLELEHAAVLIDAGGELTCEDERNNPVVVYLERFFRDTRPDLQRTLHTVLISHPHIDHTMWLVSVLERFRVLNLVDGGDERGSGRVPLFAARWVAARRGVSYYAVKNADLSTPGFENPALRSLGQLNPGATFRLLSAPRGCRDANNDSLVLLFAFREAKFLFTGDAETDDPDEPETQCGGAEITHLLDRFGAPGLLDIDVYKVGHHGSHNGTSDAMVAAMSPEISVISAGKPVDNLPCSFHAFQFGHPREETVRRLEAGTQRRRVEAPSPPVRVVTMDRPRTTRNRNLTKAVYCTCWDGNIIVEPSQDGRDFRVLTRQ